MYDILKIERGIDTFEVSIPNLKYSQVQKVRQHLQAKDAEARKINGTASGWPTGKSATSPQYFSRYYESDGFNIIRTYQSTNKSNGIYIVINPTTVLRGEYQHAALYAPTKEIGGLLAIRIMDFLEKIKLEDLHDSLIDDSRLSVSQIDVTKNIFFPKDTDLTPILHAFGKSNVPDDLHRNKRQIGFCANADTVTIKAYDKIQQLIDGDLLPLSLGDYAILRLEISMKRKKLISLLGLDREADIDTMLTAAYNHTDKIVENYLEKLFPCCADHLRYEDAYKAIRNQVKKDKLRDRMLFLLEKTSHTDGLNQAIDAATGKFSLQHNQFKRIWNEFAAIGVNPITLQNKSKVERIHNIRRLLYRYEHMPSGVKPGEFSFDDLDARMRLGSIGRKR